MISPFIGMVADRCCGEQSRAPTTNVYVQYVEIVQMAMSYNNNTTPRTEERICKLEKMIIAFKKNALSLYGNYHASKLCTEKFHLLDHIPGDIRKMGDLRSGDAGLYEHEHTDVKRANRSTSRRKQTEMRETVAAHVKDKYYRTRNWEESSQIKTSNRKTISAKQNAIFHDSNYLVRKGRSFSLQDLDNCRRMSRRIRIAEQDEDAVTLKELKDKMQLIDQTVRHLLEDIGEIGGRVLLKEFMKTCSSSTGLQTITRVASGYVSGILSQRIKTIIDDGTEYVCSIHLHVAVNESFRVGDLVALLF